MSKNWSNEIPSSSQSTSRTSADSCGLWLKMSCYVTASASLLHGIRRMPYDLLLVQTRGGTNTAWQSQPSAHHPDAQPLTETEQCLPLEVPFWFLTKNAVSYLFLYVDIMSLQKSTKIIVLIRLSINLGWCNLMWTAFCVVVLFSVSLITFACFSLYWEQTKRSCSVCVNTRSMHACYLGHMLHRPVLLVSK